MDYIIMNDTSSDAVDAVARALYGEVEYDALPEGHQVKAAYRKRAQWLLKDMVNCQGRAG